MGALVELVNVYKSQASLNVRFAAGDPIVEMAALHQEFDIFSGRHDLRAAAALLGLAPDIEPQRGEWLDYLDHLKSLSSNEEAQSGHDRIRSALAANLARSDPMPVFFRYHDGTKDPRVLVTTGTPLIFLESAHLIVSVPTLVARDAMRAAVARAGAWSSRKPGKTAAKTAAKTPAKTSAKRSAKKSGRR